MSRLAVGDGMKVFKNNSYTQLMTMTGLILLASCNQQEFYEKAFLVNQDTEESELGEPVGTLFDPESDIISFPGVPGTNNDDSTNTGDDTVADTDNGDQGSSDGDDTVADNDDQNNDQAPNDGDDTVADNDDQNNDQAPNDGDDTVADNDDQNNDQAPNDGDDTVADNDDQNNDQAPNDGDDTVADNDDQNNDQAPNDGDDTVADNVTNPTAPVCDPFGGEGSEQKNGIRGSLHDGLGQQLKVVNDYYTKGQLVSSDLYFSSLNIPTRKFNQGFLTPNGETLKSVNGQTLHEWFAINFQGRIRLNANQEAGLYEFALLNDDGAVLQVGNTRDSLSTLISSDFHTATRMSCANKLVYMNHLQDLSFNLDYFQGPREHIALILMWRKIDSENQYETDPQCGKSGPNMYFNSNTTPSTPHSAYTQLLDRGFKVVDSSNFLLPNEDEINPCVDAQTTNDTVVTQNDEEEETSNDDNNDNQNDPIIVINEEQEPEQETENIVIPNEEQELQVSNEGEESTIEDDHQVVVNVENPVVRDETRDIASNPIESTQQNELSQQTEEFLQNTSVKKKVDILWVIDNSGSMQNDQKRLADNFQTFIHEFLDRGLDFQMGITTTDATMRGDGKRVGNSQQLNADWSSKNEGKFIRDFKRLINVGTKGSPKEMGISSSVRFLQRYANLNNDEFVRDDAFLVIIYLSDEEDQSPLSVQHYANLIKGYKANPSDIKVYSITTDMSIMNQWETVGHRYMAMADIFGGIKSDIKKDFYPVLRDMGLSIANLLDSFALAGLPHNDELEVIVDGVIQETGYIYDNQTRTVRFDESSMPREGASVVIRYKTLSVETN
jgi:hypothetical protein